MNKIILFSFLFSFQLFGQKTPNKLPIKLSIKIGEKRIIKSKVLNEFREIWVYVPDSYHHKNNTKKYPVVYLLDGDNHFTSVTGIIEHLSGINGSINSPEMILVGIINTDVNERTRDLTPTHNVEELTSGGGEKFTEFLDKELIPYINSNYPTSTYKMLIGHSYGGLMVINTLIHHTEMFNSYVAIDPSMWWDNKKLVLEAQAKLKQIDFTGKSLYLGIANTLSKDIDTSLIKLDTTSYSKSIRAIFNLDDLFKKNETNLNYESKYYPDDSHGSVPLITEYDAFRFIFKEYKFNISREEWTLMNMEVIEKIEKHYKNLENIMGYPVLPDEEFINNQAYYAMSENLGKEALYLFELNCKNYPSSWNVFDSLGDFYNSTGQKELAITNYKKAISLKKNKETRKKLKSLISY